MNHYVYKITFPGTPYYYFGSRTEKKPGEEYWGSPVHNAWVWDFYEAEKQILERFDSREEAYELEYRLIRHFIKDINCLNDHYGGGFPLSSCSKAGVKARDMKVGIHAPGMAKELNRRRYEKHPPPRKKGTPIEVEVQPGSWRRYSNSKRFCEEWGIWPSAISGALKTGVLRVRKNGEKLVMNVRKLG